MVTARCTLVMLYAIVNAVVTRTTHLQKFGNCTEEVFSFDSISYKNELVNPLIFRTNI